MVFGFFAQKCPVCGMKLGDNAFDSNGKRFCSKEHAEQHEKELSKNQHKGHGSGCCH